MLVSVKKSSGRIKPVVALLISAIGLALLNGLDQGPFKSGHEAESLDASGAYIKGDVTGADVIAEAFRNRHSNLQLSGMGKVKRLLPDDNKGSRHQKMLIEMINGQTLLLSHNIDLAPRIDNVREGEWIEFFGEYEWSAKGGVIHWTHRDPRGKHPDGWIKYQGRVYQ